MSKRLILVVLALVIVFGGIFGWKYYQFQQTAAQASQPPPPATIAATEVRSESWQPYLYAVGSLVAVQGISVTNEVAGQVREILFESGQRVKKGDRLLQLDDSVDQADLEGLIAEQKLAEVQFQRTAQLFRDKSMSKSNYDEAQANLDNAKAQVTSKRALIQKKQILAPFSGLLGIRQVDVGEYLAPGSQIVPLESLHPIYADFSLPERDFSALSVGQRVLLQVQAYPKESFDGQITALNPGVDPGTRTLRIRATLDNPDGRLRAGMFAEVRTVLPERQGILTVPQTAITYNPYGDSVFIIEEQEGDLVVQNRQVETGEVRDGRVEIVKGLKEGERVVSAGQVKLRNGQKVKIDNSVQLDKQVAKS